MSGGLFPDMGASVSIDRQIACIRRELGFRTRVFPRRVANGQMTQHQMDEEMTAMNAVLATLLDVKAGA